MVGGGGGMAGGEGFEVEKQAQLPIAEKATEEPLLANDRIRPSAAAFQCKTYRHKSGS